MSTTTTTASRPRVLLVGRGAPERGGIAAFMGMLAGSSLSAHHDLEVVNVAPSTPAHAGRADRRNALRTLADVRRLARAVRPGDVVHLQTALVPGPTLLRTGALAAAARLRGGRVLVHVHNGQAATWFDRPVRRLAGTVALRGAHLVATVDDGSRRRLAPLHRAPVALVDNGVAVDRYGPPGPEQDPPRILYAGVLTPRKGLLDLLAASRALSARGVAHELLLVGGRPDEGEHAERAVREDAARTPAAHLLGPRPHEQMPDLLRAAEMFCLPSWWEAMPLSVLEAMATGLPVVATDVGDLSRAVVPDETGLLVPPRHPERLAGALAALLLDPERRRRLGAAGRARARASFDATRTVAEVDRLYATLTETRPRKGPA